MAKYPLVRVDREDSPDRCMANGPHGQCMFAKVPGSDYCSRHGGFAAVLKEEQESLRNYQINEARMRAGLVSKANSSGLVSLRDEVALARYLLEQVLNKVQTDNDLIIQSATISDLVGKIERLVVSCHKLELSTNSVVDEKQLVSLAGTIVGIITTVIDDVSALSTDEQANLKGKLATAIMTAVTESLNP